MGVRLDEHITSTPNSVVIPGLREIRTHVVVITSIATATTTTTITTTITTGQTIQRGDAFLTERTLLTHIIRIFLTGIIRVSLTAGMVQAAVGCRMSTTITHLHGRLGHVFVDPSLEDREGMELPHAMFQGRSCETQGQEGST